jgi:hypothetical protein
VWMDITGPKNCNTMMGTDGVGSRRVVEARGDGLQGRYLRNRWLLPVNSRMYYWPFTVRSRNRSSVTFYDSDL